MKQATWAAWAAAFGALLAPIVTSPAAAVQTTKAPAAMTFREAAAVWQQVDRDAADLGRAIAAGKWGEVHDLAFSVRDSVVTLPYKSNGLSASAKKKLDQRVRTVADIAVRLDKAGDANDAKATRAEQARLQNALAALRALYPAGALRGAANPAAKPSGKEAALFLTPGGAYTPADVQANGNQTVSQKYPDFAASHDTKVRPGERVCPISETRPDPKLTWIVAGKTYQFCCPPCVTEFVQKAKTNPGAIKAPEAYTKK